MSRQQTPRRISFRTDLSRVGAGRSPPYENPKRTYTVPPKDFKIAVQQVNNI